MATIFPVEEIHKMIDELDNQGNDVYEERLEYKIVFEGCSKDFIRDLSEWARKRCKSMTIINSKF